MVRVRVGDTTPEGEGAAAGASIKHASLANVSGGVMMIEGEEGKRRYHCRGCPLGVWVASSVAGVKVKEESGRVIGFVIEHSVRSLAEGGGGGREAAVSEARVHGGEAGITWQEGGVVRSHANSKVSS